MSKGTYYSQACYKVMGFQQMSEEFIRKLVINGRSRSTHENCMHVLWDITTAPTASLPEVKPVHFVHAFTSPASVYC